MHAHPLLAAHQSGTLQFQAGTAGSRLALLILGGLGLMQLLLELSIAASTASSNRASAEHIHHADHHGGHSDMHMSDESSDVANKHHSPSPPQPPPTSFCDGLPMVMGNMQGFSRSACVTLFFASWELTSHARLAAAVLLVFSGAIGYEKLRQVRCILHAFPYGRMYC